MRSRLEERVEGGTSCSTDDATPIKGYDLFVRDADTFVALFRGVCCREEWYDAQGEGACVFCGLWSG